ncbi:MAG: hypothetical protein RIQ56_877 [Candidatus Parcubacteria bacterium]|jgi:uncharacterized protein (TIGR00730 family)
MNILVACSAQEVAKEYTLAAKETAELLARRGHVLLWGGSNVGTMKEIADSARNAGGKLIGITNEYFKKVARADVDELVVTVDLAERKKVMFARSDALIALPGGIGTLDEAFEALALQRLGLYGKPITFLNTNGFYEGLRTQFQRMEQDGFLHRVSDGLVEGQIAYFAETPERAVDYVEKTVRVGA